MVCNEALAALNSYREDLHVDIVNRVPIPRTIIIGSDLHNKFTHRVVIKLGILAL